MDWLLIAWGVLAVCIIAGPFVVLRSASARQARRETAKAQPLPPDDEDPDKPTGFW